MFHVLRKLWPTKTQSHRFVDSWVLVNLILSFLSIFIVRYDLSVYLLWFIIIWGALRVFEIIIYQINVLLFDPYKNNNTFQTYALGGYRRILILSLLNYIEISFWFTSFYLQSRMLFCDPYGVLNGCLGAFYFSIVTMTTLGYGDVTPIKDLTRFLVTVQALAGVFIVVIIVARFISYLPKPKTLDESEK